MHGFLNPYTPLLFLAGIINFYVAARLTQQRRQRAARVMGLMILSSAIWAFSYGFEIAAQTLSGKLFWASMAYIGTSVIGPLYALAIAHYLYPNLNLRRTHVALLWGLFVVVNALVWTNAWHHLLWPDFTLQSIGNLSLLAVQRGPLFYVLMAYTYLSIGLGLYMLLNSWNRVAPQRRRDLTWVLIAALVPWGLSIIATIAGRSLTAHVNLTPFSSALSGLVLSWAMFRLSLAPILPIARELALDSMRDGAVVLDRERGIVDLNRAAEQILKVRLESVLGVRWEALLETIPNLAIRPATESPAGVTELIFLSPENRTYELHITPIESGRGATVGELVLLRDVTEQRHAEAEAMAQRHYLEQQNLQLLKLSRAIEQSANAVVITDTEGRIEYVNPSFTAITGYTPEETYGQNPRILKSGEHPPAMYRILWETIKSGKVWRGEFHNRRKDGSLYWERATIAPIFDSQRKIVNFVAIKEDITALKEAEEAQQRYMLRLSLQHEITESLIAAKSAQAIAVAAVNRLWRLIPSDRTLVFEVREGRPATLLAAQANGPLMPGVGENLPLYQSLHEDVRMRRGLTQGHEDLELMRDLTPFQRALLNEGIRGYVVIPLLAEGRLIGSLHLQTLTPRAFTQEHLVTAQEVAASLGVAIYQAQLYDRAQQEIAERKQAQAHLQMYAKELEARNSELDTFAHMVAHDLKNPLNAVLGYSEMLLEDAGASCNAMQREMLQEVVRSAERMLSIIDELLVLSSLHHIEKVGQSELDMALIVAEVQGRLRYMIETSGAVIIVPDQWPKAMGYSAWVEEVWANYISNAIKYGGQPPRVELGATDLKNGWLRFWVKDNGPGVTEEEKARLFVPFTRMDQIRARGHGLGLSIVRQIVERMGGEVGVESTPGQGATFYFTLRAAASAHDTVVQLRPR